MFRFYIFDLDGTLCDSLRDLQQAANRVRAHFGLKPLDEARIRRFIGDGVQRLLHRVLRDDEQGEALPAQLATAEALFKAEYGRHLAQHTRLYPGVRECLAELQRRGAGLAVISNKNEDLARSLLQQLGIADFFALIYGGDTFAQRKPEALPLLRAQEFFRAPSAQMLMIGDSHNDLAAARAAGWRMLHCRYGFESVAGADFQVDDFPSILNIPGGIQE